MEQSTSQSAEDRGHDEFDYLYQANQDFQKAVAEARAAGEGAEDIKTNIQQRSRELFEGSPHCNSHVSIEATTIFIHDSEIICMGGRTCGQLVDIRYISIGYEDEDVDGNRSYHEIEGMVLVLQSFDSEAHYEPEKLNILFSRADVALIPLEAVMTIDGISSESIHGRLVEDEAAIVEFLSSTNLDKEGRQEILANWLGAISERFEYIGEPVFIESDTFEVINGAGKLIALPLGVVKGEVFGIKYINPKVSGVAPGLRLRVYVEAAAEWDPDILRHNLPVYILDDGTHVTEIMLPVSADFSLELVASKEAQA